MRENTNRQAAGKEPPSLGSGGPSLAAIGVTLMVSKSVVTVPALTGAIEVTEISPHVSPAPTAPVLPHGLPVGRKYQIIYADPPWSYRNRKVNGAAATHYATMSLEAIKALPVSDLATAESVLLMWATMPLIGEALEVIKAWGFVYKTNGFTWVKRNKSDTKYFFGVGWWTRSNFEPCLLAVRGRPRPVTRSMSQLIIEPVRRHSEKPPIVRDKIVQLLGDKMRIELFARSRAAGWDAWGDGLPAEPVRPPS